MNGLEHFHFILLSSKSWNEIEANKSKCVKASLKFVLLLFELTVRRTMQHRLTIIESVPERSESDLDWAIKIKRNS
jgi:hypothetical protein